VATYQTKFGPVEYSNVPSVARAISQNRCVEPDVPFDKRHETVKLQPAALEAFRAAEKLFGKKVAVNNGWKPKLAKARAIEVTGSWRDYDYQVVLYARDSSRYAKPWVSGHVQGLCIDVNTTLPFLDDANAALAATGWRRVRSDEPWHWSWGVLV
jgi:hypothetical protein